MAEGNNLFEKIDIDFTEIKTNLNDVKKFTSFDDQHDLTNKIKLSNTKRRLNLFQKTKYFCNSFFTAANSNDVNSIKNSLINGDYDVNFSDSKGRTALHLAAAKGNYEAAQILLKNGSNPNSKDLNGNTPLHLSALSNHIRLITLLLKSGANLNEIDNNGRTPLNLAKSKLKILQDCTSYNSDELKQEAKYIIEMMQIYLTKCGKKEKSIYLNQFINRLNLHNNKEDVDNDLCDLLQSINNLNIN